MSDKDKDDIFTSDKLYETLGQYLGLPEELSKDSANLLDALAPAPDEEGIKAEMRLEFKDVLDSLQSTSAKGYGDSVREALSSQQRQELADSARRMGGSQRMLSGRSKAAARVQGYTMQKQAQAGVIQNVAEQEKQLKQSSKDELASLEDTIAKSAQTKADTDRETRLKAGLSLFQLAQLADQAKKGM
mgnify:CR=1 FL=1